MATEPKKKPAHVPAKAVWDDDGWEYGAHDAQGRRIGTWTWWRENGVVGGGSEYGDGTTRMTYVRYHPDGELAQRGEKDLVADRWTGLMRWTRQARPSPEDAFFPNMVGPAVRAFEVDLVDGYITTERCFDAKGAPVTRTGAAVPARPAGVPAEAFLVDGDASWLKQQRFAGDNHLRGVQATWDRNGTLGVRRLYRDDGSLAEEDSYKDGALWMAKRHQPGGDFTQAFFQRGTTPPVVKESTLYRNNQNDRETTFFDATGARAFSIRMEEVSDHHLRRYDDGKLVFEAIWSSDPSKPPSKVEYYGHDGVVLVRYQATRKGQGVWRLLRRDGSTELELADDGERERNQDGTWDLYLRGFAQYELGRTRSDPEEIRANFLDRYARDVARTTLDRMKAPAPLVAALGPGPWRTDDSAMGGAKELPTLVKGVLADDEAIARYALERIWVEIEHQGSLYQATYRLATALATMLPLVGDRPAVQRRVFAFVRDVLDLPGIDGDRSAFARLAKAVRACEPVLVAWATGGEPVLAAHALRVLGRVGRGVELALARMHQGATPDARAYAACVYVSAAPPKVRKDVVARALAAERDPFVRFVQALLLAEVDHLTTPTVLAAIEPYLLDPSAIAERFAGLDAFLSADVTEAILQALPVTSLATYAAAIVAALPKQGALVQVSYLRTIFATVLPQGLPRKPTPAQAQTLRALATVIDTRGNFVNHMNVYAEHGIPYDSFVLREAAEGRSAAVLTGAPSSLTLSAASSRPRRSLGVPAKQAPAKQAPAKQAPAKQATARKASAKQASARKATARKASAKQATTGGRARPAKKR